MMPSATVVPRISRAEAQSDLASRFNALRLAWHREYGASSSVTKITSCPSYREIVRLGDSALPFIFRDLRGNPNPSHWLDAIREITKQDPVPPQYRGHPRKMIKFWLKWARDKGGI